MRLVVLGIAFALGSVACGDNPSGPSSGARAEAVVQDSPASPPTMTGTLAGNVYASLWDGSRWVDLGSPNGITITLQAAGASTTVHGEQSVPAGSYSRVRIVFQGVTARVARGSTIGGTTLMSDASIRIGGSDQRVEMTVPVEPFTVENDPAMKRRVVFELRSQEWLTAGALQSGQVEDTALQAAVAASTRAERR